VGRDTPSLLVGAIQGVVLGRMSDTPPPGLLSTSLKEISQGRVRVEIPQRFIEYSKEEYELWGDPLASLDLRDRYRSRVGLMTRDDVLETQRESNPSWNYVEYKLASSLLIDKLGFKQDDIVSENFRLSAKGAITKGKRRLAGIAIVKRSLTDDFFNKFDQIFEANKAAYSTAREAKDVHVDLAAASKPLGLFGLWEAKKYAPGSTKHEGLQGHQELALATAAYLMHSEAQRHTSLNPGVKSTCCEVAVFYANVDGRPEKEPDHLSFELVVDAISL